MLFIFTNYLLNFSTNFSLFQYFMIQLSYMEETTVNNNTKTSSANKTTPHKPHHNWAAIITTVVVISLAIFFGVQLVTDSGVFHQPGEIIYAETATEQNRDFVTNNLPTDLELTENLVIGSTSLTQTSDNPTYLLYDVLVPVADFYSTTTDVSSEDAKKGILLSVWNLTPAQKLLSLDGKYYLDNLNEGALFEYLTFVGNTEDIEKVKNLLAEKIAALPTKDTILTLAQTGVTALSRRMNSRLDQIGNAKFFSEKIAPFLSQFDLTHTSNESSFSNNANGSNICSKPAMIDVLTDIGLDIVELTGNHNQDCGDQDAIATIDQYNNLGIQVFGGGKTSTEAAIPLQIDQKDSHITLLGYNLSTGGYTLDNTPGANFYTEEKAIQDISAAKERGDTVIVDIQYYECNSYVNTNEDPTCDRADSAAGDQVGFFRHLIDLGADIVVGTAAHQPQTFELYKDGYIYYGLGNLFFDQSAWPGTTRSLVLVHYFWNNDLIQTRIFPTIYDESFQTHLMDTTDAAAFIDRLTKVRPTN